MIWKKTSLADYYPLAGLMAWADIVTFHVSKLPDQQLSIGAKELNRMKRGGWLVNCARGGIVDETALYDALKSGQLSAAALDVFEQEPYQGRLRELKNVILTPHIGSYAREARIAMEIEAVNNLVHSLKGAS
jgi:D-3-phosphoglycerate dehydrogenase